MRVLPYRLCDNQWCVWRDCTKYFHPVFLTVDESMFFYRIEQMCSLNLSSQQFHRSTDFQFHGILSRFTLLVGAKPQITAGNKIDSFHKRTFISLLIIIQQ